MLVEPIAGAGAVEGLLISGYLVVSGGTISDRADSNLATRRSAAAAISAGIDGTRRLQTSSPLVSGGVELGSIIGVEEAAAEAGPRNRSRSRSPGQRLSRRQPPVRRPASESGSARSSGGSAAGRSERRGCASARRGARRARTPVRGTMLLRNVVRSTGASFLCGEPSMGQAGRRRLRVVIRSGECRRAFRIGSAVGNSP